MEFNCALEARCNSPLAQPPRRPPWYIEPDAAGAPPPKPEPNGFANAPLNDGAPELAGADAPVAPALGVAFVVEIALLDLPVDGVTAGAAAGAAEAEAAGVEADADAFAGSAAGDTAACAAGITGAGDGVGAGAGDGVGVGVGAGGNSVATSISFGLGASLGMTLGVS